MDHTEPVLVSRLPNIGNIRLGALGDNLLSACTSALPPGQVQVLAAFNSMI